MHVSFSHRHTRALLLLVFLLIGSLILSERFRHNRQRFGFFWSFS